MSNKLNYFHICYALSKKIVIRKRLSVRVRVMDKVRVRLGLGRDNQKQ